MVKRLAVYRSENRSGRLIGALRTFVRCIRCNCIVQNVARHQATHQVGFSVEIICCLRHGFRVLLFCVDKSSRLENMRCNAKTIQMNFNVFEQQQKKNASSKQRAMLELMTTTKKMSAMERQSFVEQRQETRSKRWNDENYLLSSRCRWQFCTLQFNSLSLSLFSSKRKKNERKKSAILFLFCF